MFQNQSQSINANKRRPRWSGLSRMIHIQDECVRRFIRRIADIITNHHYASADFGKNYTVGQLGSYKNVNCSDQLDVIRVHW